MKKDTTPFGDCIFLIKFKFTKAVIFAKILFDMTTKEDKVRTCYMQACLAYVNFEAINNTDIRKIFFVG